MVVFRVHARFYDLRPGPQPSGHVDINFKSRAELRTNNSELELSVEDLSYMYVYEIYVLHACLISFVSL